MSAYIQQSSVMTGRQMVMGVTIGLHVMVIGGLMTMKVMPDAVPEIPRILVQTRTEEPPPDEPRPMPEVKLAHERSYVPTLPGDISMPREDIVVQGPDIPVWGGPTTTTTQETGSARIAPVLTELTYQAVRSTDDYYPRISQQLAEEGATVVRVCVDAQGRIEGRPTVQSTSGSRRLDAAAVDWTREALRFTPATRDGVPMAACKGFRVRFNLR